MLWTSPGSGGRGWFSFCIEAREAEVDDEDDEASEGTGDVPLLSIVIARCEVAVFAFGVLVLKGLS